MNYEFSLYIVHQLINRLLYMKLFFYSPFFILFVLFSGCLTAMNPCIVSMLPILSLYLDIDHEKGSNLFFILFGLLFTELFAGSIISAIGYYYYTFLKGLPLLLSFLYIVLGLSILQVFFFDLLKLSFSSNFFYISNLYLRNFLFGVLLAINTLPCTLPIFLTIFNLLLLSNNFMFLVVYSTLYILGYISPILLFYFLLQNIQNLSLGKMLNISKVYILLGGGFLLSSGLFKFLTIIFYNFG